jgi:hypothetical protein
LAGQRNLSARYPDGLQHNRRDISCGVPAIFLSAVEGSLKKNGGIAGVILFVLCQIGFVSRVSNREQAFKADGVKGTIWVSSVREKRRNRESHRAASFRGEFQRYGSFVQKDVQLSTVS